MKLSSRVFVIDLAKVVSSMFCILVLFIYVIILDLCGNKISPYILKATVPTQRKPHLVYSDVTVLLSLTQGCTKFFPAGKQPYSNLNWLPDFMHIFLV